MLLYKIKPVVTLIQRCQWHKRENITSHLPKTEQSQWRQRLQRAYERPNYKEAHRELKKIRAELDEMNQSAVASLEEGFEETLTLHRLGLFARVGRSLKTTNVLESVNAQAEQRCGRVDHWKNSNCVFRRSGPPIPGEVDRQFRRKWAGRSGA